ncbi:hypothetical protein CANCADRAFT_1941 [Tortispora caseinolytica NRRL Y-17796]|uniref:Adenosine kinase n=1 Tax=Tortispora caseinolytica NRRL Y-17796 TaxID=767744 RepID=A0A1E4TEL0_9ASCO|nr:hypothetical protein CANCADRAFT_1941 [Tortispora caseinolytica NRRL Y-17796]
MSYPLLCLGNPLLDIQVNVDQAYLDKWQLGADSAILAEEKHMPIFDEVLTMNPLALPGGAAQNSARGAQYMLPPNSVVYIGCVGNDKYAETLRAANAKEGVKSAYRVDPEVETGKCAVLITGHHRSLVTDLGAANHYKLEHLKSPEIWSLVEGAKYYYVGGYHLTVCVPAIIELGKHAAEQNKIFSINLSAPFIPTVFKDQLDSVLPYADILIGNEDEAAQYGESHGLGKDLEVVGKSIVNLPKENVNRSRVVIITQSTEDTLIFTKSGDSVELARVPVVAVKEESIVDTNGAGDAFAGGFLAGLVENLSLEECVKRGQWLASWGIRQNGPAYPVPKVTFPQFA